MTRVPRLISLVLGAALLLWAVPVMGRDEPVEAEATVSASGISAEAVTSPSPTPAPSPEPVGEASPRAELPTDLPTKPAPEVPLFAGPSALRLSGGRGAYRWHEVLFGSQEVRLKVALTPRSESCVAHVRLVEDEGPVFSRWFEVHGGVKEAEEVIVDADYGAGRLKIDSDCKHWVVRFAPLPDPELETSIDERYYIVRGDTIDELASQTTHIDGKWAAYTEWFTDWTFQSVAATEGVSCDVVDGSTSVTVNMTSPQWQQPASVDPSVVAEWERFSEALRTHELGHVTIALQGADAIDDRLDKGLTASTCEQARTAADEKATRIFDRYSRLSRRYDQETDHGLSQGTGLE